MVGANSTKYEKVIATNAKQSRFEFRISSFTNEIVHQMTTVSVMCRAVSKMVPNRPLFGDSFDRPGSSRDTFLVSEQAISLPRKSVGRVIAVL